jgi:hypothetical protein
MNPTQIPLYEYFSAPNPDRVYVRSCFARLAVQDQIPLMGLLTLPCYFRTGARAPVMDSSATGPRSIGLGLAMT